MSRTIALVALVLSTLCHVEATVQDFMNCLHDKIAPSMEHCHGQYDCSKECLHSVRSIEPHLDGSCCDKMSDEAPDQVSPCKAKVQGMSGSVEASIKQHCPSENFGKELYEKIMKTVGADELAERAREDKVVDAFDHNDVQKLFALYDKDGNKRLTSDEQDKFLEDLENISFLELPAEFKKKAKADHGMTEQEFKDKYSALTGEFQNMQKEAIKSDMKKELKQEITELLADYDKDQDGKLSAAEQRQFLEDLQKAYSVDLSDELERTQQAETAEDLMAEPEQYSALSAQPSAIVTFLVSAAVGAALTTLGIHVYRRSSRKVGLEDNYALLNA